MPGSRRSSASSSESGEQNAWEKYVQPIFAEFVGTALYTFLACMAVTGSGLFGIGIAHGFGIAALCTGFIEIRYINCEKVHFNLFLKWNQNLS